jgi:hypothetical protein
MRIWSRRERRANGDVTVTMLCSVLGLTLRELASGIGVPINTLYRAQEISRLSYGVRRALIYPGAIAILLAATFPQVGARIRWLRSGDHRVGGKSPLALMRAGAWQAVLERIHATAATDDDQEWSDDQAVSKQVLPDNQWTY